MINNYRISSMRLYVGGFSALSFRHDKAGASGAFPFAPAERTLPFHDGRSIPTCPSSHIPRATYRRTEIHHKTCTTVVFSAINSTFSGPSLRKSCENLYDGSMNMVCLWAGM